MEETSYLPANGPQSSSSRDTRWINAQLSKLKRLTGSHRFKIRLFSVLLIIALIIIIIALVVFILQRPEQLSAGPCLNVSCPESWVGYRGRCYYFSETKGTWDFGQRNCSSYGAFLAAIDAPWELDFLMRLKGRSDSWIGLHRADTEEPWKWTNGSLFNNWFNIAADGFCVYLEDGASSTWCDTQRHWICRKS